MLLKDLSFSKIPYQKLSLILIPQNGQMLTKTITNTKVAINSQDL